MSRATREPDYDFGPYEDEYRGFEIRDDETGRGPLILVLALGVLLIFAGVVWNTYRQGVRPTEGGLPVIASDETPYKRSPEARGGLEVAGQDKSYYDSMDGLGDPALEAKTIGSPIDIRPDPVLEGGPGELPPIEGSDEPPRIKFAESMPRPEARPEPMATREPSERSLQIAAVQPVQEEPAPTIADPVPSRFTAGGGYQVQLSALRSEAAARSAWTMIQSSAPDLFAGADLDIQRADLGAKGVFYRLRVGSFADRATAKGFCEDVKAAGKDCMVVAKANG